MLHGTVENWKKSENSRILAECAQKQTQIEKHIQTVKSLQNQTLKAYNYASYKILTSFVRFMLWDSRKFEKNQKTAVYLLNAHKNTNRKTHPNSEIIAKSNTEGTEVYLIRC